MTADDSLCLRTWACDREGVGKACTHAHTGWLAGPGVGTRERPVRTAWEGGRVVGPSPPHPCAQGSGCGGS